MACRCGVGLDRSAHNLAQLLEPRLYGGNVLTIVGHGGRSRRSARHVRDRSHLRLKYPTQNIAGAGPARSQKQERLGDQHVLCDEVLEKDLSIHIDIR